MTERMIGRPISYEDAARTSGKPVYVHHLDAYLWPNGQITRTIDEVAGRHMERLRSVISICANRIAHLEEHLAEEDISKKALQRQVQRFNNQMHTLGTMVIDPSTTKEQIAAEIRRLNVERMEFAQKSKMRDGDGASLVRGDQ